MTIGPLVLWLLSHAHSVRVSGVVGGALPLTMLFLQLSHKNKGIVLLSDLNGEYQMSTNFNRVVRPAATAPAANQPAPASTNGKADDRPKPQVYGNVGFPFEITNGDGETDIVTIYFPIGLAIDTMPEMEVRGQNLEWNERCEAMNAVLEEFKSIGDAMEPGEEKVFEGATLQLKRIGKPAAKSPNGNSLVSAIKARLSVVK